MLEASESTGEGHRFENLDELKGVDANYSSYEDHRQQADDLFEQLHQVGERCLSKKWASWLPAAIGVIAVPCPQKGWKYRLAHDLRRKGVSVQIVVPERLVLPRLRDAHEDALRF